MRLVFALAFIRLVSSRPSTGSGGPPHANGHGQGHAYGHQNHQQGSHNGSAISLLPGNTNPSCGQSNVNSSLFPHTVGGQLAVAKSAVWTCALFFNGGQMCGASLIIDRNNKVGAITAAHCVTNNRPRLYYLVCGRLSMSDPNAQRLNVRKIVPHPDYGHNGPSCDIAFLKLETTRLGDPKLNGAGAICLPTRLSRPGEMGLVSGWGSTSTGGSTTDDLKISTRPVLSNQVCDRAYSGFGGVDDTMMCAGYIGTKMVDDCQSDSGGPLAIQDSDGSWELAGVVSWGVGCASTDYPDIYTSAFHFKTWISSQLGKI